MSNSKHYDKYNELVDAILDGREIEHCQNGVWYIANNINIDDIQNYRIRKVEKHQHFRWMHLWRSGHIIEVCHKNTGKELWNKLGETPNWGKNISYRITPSHKHRDIIDQWANNLELICQYLTSKPYDLWADLEFPTFNAMSEFRIKPTPKKEEINFDGDRYILTIVNKTTKLELYKDQEFGPNSIVVEMGMDSDKNRVLMIK